MDEVSERHDNYQTLLVLSRRFYSSYINPSPCSASTFASFVFNWSIVRIGTWTTAFPCFIVWARFWILGIRSSKVISLPPSNGASKISYETVSFHWSYEPPMERTKLEAVSKFPRLWKLNNNNCNNAREHDRYIILETWYSVQYRTVCVSVIAIVLLFIRTHKIIHHLKRYLLENLG